MTRRQVVTFAACIALEALLGNVVIAAFIFGVVYFA